MSTLAIRPRRSKIRRPFGEGILPIEPDRNDLDHAWDIGWYIGRHDLPGIAPSDWCDMMKDAFYDGIGEGQKKREADEAHTLEVEFGVLVSLNSREGGEW
jgi:hypothetical protein